MNRWTIHTTKVCPRVILVVQKQIHGHTAHQGEDTATSGSGMFREGPGVTANKLNVGKGFPLALHHLSPSHRQLFVDSPYLHITKLAARGKRSLRLIGITPRACKAGCFSILTQHHWVVLCLQLDCTVNTIHVMNRNTANSSSCWRPIIITSPPIAHQHREAPGTLSVSRLTAAAFSHGASRRHSRRPG